MTGRKAVIGDTSALRPVPRHGAVLAAVKIAPFGDRLSLVLDDCDRPESEPRIICSLGLFPGHS